MTKLLTIRIVTFLVIAALDGFTLCVLISRDSGGELFVFALGLIVFFCGMSIAFIQAIGNELWIRYYTGKKEGYEEGKRQRDG